jgi:TM2 domain-containing membrane protein YozV
MLPALPPRAVLMVSQKSSGLAAVMSFFWSGLGQIYTGQIAKGILMMIFIRF